MINFSEWLENKLNEDKWMQELDIKKGALTAAAEAAGKTISQYCKSPPSTLATKRCTLWKTFKKAKH